MEEETDSRPSSMTSYCTMRVYTDASLNPKLRVYIGVYMVLGEAPKAHELTIKNDIVLAEIMTMHMAMHYVLARDDSADSIHTLVSDCLNAIEMITIPGKKVKEKYQEYIYWMREQRNFTFVHVKSHQLKREGEYTTDDTCNYIVDSVAKKTSNRRKLTPEVSFISPDVYRLQFEKTYRDYKLQM